MTEETLFAAALEKGTPAERAVFLDEACAGDEPLRRRVAALLQSHDHARFLGTPAAKWESQDWITRQSTINGLPATIERSAPAESPGTVIGPYKLLQQIGEGGMGTVFMAEQTQPVRRKVALKVIKPGMDSRQVIARFEAERQALAMMDHANIARVLDAGATESGRPYFVMELVHGVPITKYCDDNHLTPRERLELFVPVCQAIQHAHQKGIIHRDIKPSNVMITLYDGKPVPKVIDFGVAKATEQTADRADAVHAVRHHGRHAGIHEPGAGRDERPGRRYPQRHLLAGRAPVRAADGQHAAHPQAGQGGGLWRGSPHDQGGGAAQAEHAAERLGRSAGVHLGPAPHGAGQAGEADARRAGLDRDEGAGEGPQPPLRDGQRLRRRSCSAT